MRRLSRLLIIASTVTLTCMVTSERPVRAQAATPDPFKTRAFADTDESGSPDGLFVVGRKDAAPGRLYLRDLKTGTERILVDLPGAVDHAVWSPDSQRLAFTLVPKAPAAPEVRIITLATGANRTLSASGSVLAWTKTNEALVSTRRFMSNVDWSLIPVDGGAAKVIFTSTNWLEAGGLTADGASLIFAKGGRIVLHDVATGLERTVTAIDADERFLALSPDGRLLAFASDMNGDWAVYVAPLDRLPVTRLLRVANLEAAPDGAVAWWTPAGTLALTHVTYSATALYRMDVDAKTGRASGTFRRLTHGPDDETPLVSSDGKLVKYWFRDGDVQGVAVLDVSSGAMRRVRTLQTSPGLNPNVFAWRSAEELLVYGDTSVQPAGFAVLNTKTGAPQPLAAATIARRQFDYVPRTQEVLYAEGNAEAQAVKLKARSLASDADRVVATIDFLLDFRASPNGRQIAYSHWLSAPGPGRQPDSELRLMTLDGVPERLLLSTQKASQTLADWSPDGRFLLFFDWNDVPRVMNVGTLESWALLDSANQPEWWNDEATWAADGTFIVMTGYGSWQEPHPLAWEGVTYEAVTRLLARRDK